MSPKIKKQTKIIAAIDIGTNSFHLIVCEANVTNGHFKILDREKEIVRLGSGSTDMKYLSEGAMNRGINTLKRFKRIADSFSASIRAVATSAVREAMNQGEFIRRVKIETGISVEVASGFEEARLIYLGVLQALPVFNKKIVLIDIGGGSTEFLGGFKKDVSFGNSLKLGAVRLTQRFFKSDITQSKEIKECRKYVKGMLAPIVRGLEKFRYELAIGSSGTILTLAQCIRAAKGLDIETPLNGFSFSRKELMDIIDAIVSKETVEERAEIPGIDPSRADIILAGAIILEQIFQELDIRRMTISDFALREGIILDTIEKQSDTLHIGHLNNIRYNSILHLAQQYRFEEKHSRHVAKLALLIFDKTQDIHRLGKTERGYLETAALLHEIGLFVSHSQHHRHSYYLIRNAEIFGYSENEKEIIANIARYHRKSHPKIKHENFRILSNEGQNIVTKLAAILRLADGLDRTHSSSVRSVDIVKRNTNVTLKILPKSRSVSTELEVWGADRKKLLFEEAFHSTVRIKQAVK